MGSSETYDLKSIVLTLRCSQYKRKMKSENKLIRLHGKTNIPKESKS